MLLLMLSSVLWAEKYKLDAVHSGVHFKVQHFSSGYSWGRFNDFKGSLEWDDNDLAASKISIEVQADSVDSNNSKRDQHLRNADFLNAKEFPTIVFDSTSISPKDSQTYTMSGDLTLHGVTKTIEVELVKTGAGKDPWGGSRVGYETQFTVKRSDFGMTYNLEGIGDEIHMMISLEGVKR